ncbi:phage virulence factor PagK family protein, partial [Salmonella enterica]|nr:phage virulence factor [Salmonella enterica]EBQ3909985.1 phage virulence factor [Salmonella enterica]EBV1759424.1 phage virulence factor [Salmonella enterica subsp. enterica serovar Newport]EIR0422475.1 phage virulence factor PagK family protein [Salmonella enterica]
ILPPSLYSALTIAADSQYHKKEEKINTMSRRWCTLWPAAIPVPEDWFKICGVY